MNLYYDIQNCQQRTAEEYSAARLSSRGTQLEVHSWFSFLSSRTKGFMLLLAHESNAVRGIRATHSPSLIAASAITPIPSHDPSWLMHICIIEKSTRYVHPENLLLYILMQNNAHFFTPLHKVPDPFFFWLNIPFCHISQMLEILNVIKPPKILKLPCSLISSSSSSLQDILYAKWVFFYNFFSSKKYVPFPSPLPQGQR